LISCSKIGLERFEMLNGSNGLDKWVIVVANAVANAVAGYTVAKMLIC